METRKVLVEDPPVLVSYEGNKLYIGDMPQLVVDLETQENYIISEEGKTAYYREITLSKDLLAGKRKNVLVTATRHYYEQACQVLEGKKTAKKYRQMKQL